MRTDRISIAAVIAAAAITVASAVAAHAAAPATADAGASLATAADEAVAGSVDTGRHHTCGVMRTAAWPVGEATTRASPRRPRAPSRR